jgi:hypothetical protein
MYARSHHYLFMMSTHLRFDDEGDILKSTHFRYDDEDSVINPRVVASVKRKISDSGDSWNDDEESWISVDEDNDSESFDDEPGINESNFDDEEKVNTLTTHTRKPTSHEFRHLVDMTKFDGLNHYEAVMVNMKAEVIVTLNGRVAELIGWVMHKQSVDEQKAVNIITEEHPLILLQYVVFIKCTYGYKNSTVYNHLLDIGHWATYLAIYERRNVDNLRSVIKERQKTEHKLKVTDEGLRLTRENAIAKKEWPLKGKQELSDCILKNKPTVDAIFQAAMEGDIVPKTKLMFANDFVVSHVFAENPQGRSKAIKMLTLESFNALNKYNQASSTNFKTQSTYGVQVVNFNPTTLKYVEAYITYIRPLLVGSTACDTVFINMNGLQHSDIGICVTRFFKSQTEYHITTNRLRSMFQTEVFERVERGEIEEHEGAAVVRNSGHGNATFRNHYLKRKAEDAGSLAMATHEKVYSADRTLGPPTPSRLLDAPYMMEEEEEEEHNSNDAVGMFPIRKRIEWSDAELKHLLAWVNDYTKQFGHYFKKDWRACVAAMREFKEFHPLHLTTNALREAWRRDNVKKAKLGLLG